MSSEKMTIFLKHNRPRNAEARDGYGAVAFLHLVFALAVFSHVCYTIFNEAYMTRIKFDATDDIINICQDNVFKAVFTKNSPESEKALAELLSCLIGRQQH
jgi:hypothetical protein